MKLGLLLLLALLAGCMRAQVAFDRVLHAGREPQNWLTYSGNYTGSRYSSLVFGDGQDGDFVALDNNTRKPLWSAYLSRLCQRQRTNDLLRKRQAVHNRHSRRNHVRVRFTGVVRDIAASRGFQGSRYSK